MLHPVAGPGGRGTAERQKPAAAERARGQNLGPGFIICGVFDRDRAEVRHRAEHRFAEAVREHIAVPHDVLLERVRHDVRDPGRRLVRGHRLRVLGVEDRGHGEVPPDRELLFCLFV